MPRFAPALPAAVAFVAATLLFSICLRNDFVYDDVLLIQMDDRIASPSNWSRYLTESYNGGVDNLYRPLASLSYAVQYYFHGATPWPYFAVNILLHAACAAAVAELTRRLVSTCAHVPGAAAGPMITAIYAGLLFAVHPVHSEAVASVVGRCETLCALAILLAMILFCRSMSGARAVGIWACGVVALLSKEQGLLLPLILLLQYRLLPRPPSTRRGGGLLLVMLLCWTWAGYIVFRESTLKFWWDRSMLDWTQQPMILSQGVDRWLWPIAILGRYARLLLFPSSLSIDYGFAVTTPALAARDPYLWLGVYAIFIWGVCVAAAIRTRNRLMTFLLLAMAVTYAVISNGPTIIGTIMGERLIYLPSVFFIIALAIVLRSARWIGTVVVAAACVLGSVRAFTYIARFDDRLSFYTQSVQEQPASVKLRVLLGAELVNRNRLDDAAKVAAEARALTPTVSEVWYQSGYIEYRRQNYDRAVEFLSEAFRLHKNPSKATALIGEALTARDRAATQPATRPSPK